ncbi:MAG: nucleotidyl transferase AbiEii/AbiGii toxin family protein [Sandaracinaceae bacterium]|nr:nucleotidyl transferase AbiEii/AbiGii toxin family protein [Sandaracinaceae bacterium]
MAVNLHGVPRMTYDLDIVVPFEAGSLRGTREALESLGLRCRLPIVLESLAEQGPASLAERSLVAVTFTDSNNPLREVDVLVAPPLPASDIVSRAIVLASGALRVPVVSLEDLVVMKRAGGRPQDLADLAHLERIRGRR